MKRLLVLMIGCLIWVSQTTAQADPERITLTHEEVERAFWLNVPDTAPETQRSAVIALHPTASSGHTMQLLTGLDNAAQEAGFVTVYPDSLGLTWGENATDTEAADDIGFLKALIDVLHDDYAINDVYLTGTGNGGLLAFRAACEIPDDLRGVAIINTLMWDYHRDNCPETTTAPVDMLLIHGTKSHFYTTATHTYERLFDPEQNQILGLQDTLDFWTRRNACTGPQQRINDNASLYSSCEGNTRVASYAVLGGGQQWPRQGEHQVNQVSVDAGAVLLHLFAHDPEWSQPQSEPFTGQPRTYTAYVPASYDPTTPTPLVIGLHGRFGTGAGHASLTDTNLWAEEENFIAVYPDGLSFSDPLDTGWNYVNGAGIFPEGVDDTAFILALIDDLANDLNIDRERVYVNGMSNGGFMVHRLACEAPDVFAGFADVAGSGFQGLETVCDFENPTPVRMLIIHGSEDNNVLWAGRAQNIGGRQIFLNLPIPQMVGFWAAYNQCDNSADSDELPRLGQSPDTLVRVLTVRDCQPNSAVVLYTVIGGGHNWPGVPGRISESVAGRVNLDIHATRVIWDFFAQSGRFAAE
jgi:polyhydroxybutyrate depolymerase